MMYPTGPVVLPPSGAPPQRSLNLADALTHHQQEVASGPPGCWAQGTPAVAQHYSLTPSAVSSSMGREAAADVQKEARPQNVDDAAFTRQEFDKPGNYNWNYYSYTNANIMIIHCRLHRPRDLHHRACSLREACQWQASRSRFRLLLWSRPKI